MDENFKAPGVLSSAYLMNFSLEFTSRSLAKVPVAPLERIKILLQTQEAIPSLKDKYKGIADCLLRVYKEQGLASFWRGFLPSIVRYAPFYFLSSSLAKYYHPEHSNQSSIQRIVSKGLISVIPLFLVYPIDFIRTRLAADVGNSMNREFKNSFDCMKKIVSKDGVSGLYRGFLASAAGVWLYRLTYFTSYSAARSYYEERGISPLKVYYIASFITFFSNLVTYPLEVVRKRMMMQSGQEERMYSNYRDCFSKILKVEGVRGFYCGFMAHLILAHGASVALVMIG